ncbi:3-hexulose-6-phosphate synthase [Actinomycetaceae bacterium L2_0104]
MAARLQLALDDIEYREALDLIERVQAHIDIVEVGTPLLMRYGMPIVCDVKRLFPQVQLLCDAKIMDGAKLEAQLAFDAGADYVTILAVTDDSSIRDCIETAQEWDRRVMVDMMCVSDLGSRVRQLEDIGVELVAVHTGVDQQARGRTPLEDLRALSEAVTHAQIAVAGGISLDTAPQYIALDPDILIVGTGIVAADDPLRESRKMHQLIQEAAG